MTNGMLRLGHRTKAASKAVSTGLALSALAAGVAFLTNILMSRQLGPGPRGEVAFVLQLAYMLTPLVLLGVDRQALRHSTTSSQSHLPAHLTVACVALTGVAFAISRDWQALVGPVVYTLATLTMLRSTAFRLNSFRWYLWFVIGYQLTICLGAVLLYSFNVDNWVAWTAPYAAPAAVMLVFVLVKEPQVLAPKRMLSDINVDALALLPAGFAAVVVTRLDRVLLGILSTDSQLGLYVAVATATEVLAWLANSLADHRVARYGAQAGRRRQLLMMLARDSLLFIPLAACAGLAIWLGLLPVLGSEFTPGSALIAPLCLAAVALSLYRQAVSWNLGSASPRRATIVETATALVAVPVYAVAVSAWAAVGAAWSSLLVYLVGCAIGVAFAQRTER